MTAEQTCVYKIRGTIRYEEALQPFGGVRESKLQRADFHVVAGSVGELQGLVELVAIEIVPSKTTIRDVVIHEVHRETQPWIVKHDRYAKADGP